MPEQNEPPYIVVWVSTVTGDRGQSTRPMIKAQAELMAQSLNEQYPTVRHWIVPCITTT